MSSDRYEENTGRYFTSALADFTSDVASGDAIRHLADLGLSVDEIYDRLDFPTPKEKIASVVWKHLIKTGVIRMEEPDGTPREKVSYVKEYDSFGRASFRQVREIINPDIAGRMTDKGSGTSAPSYVGKGSEASNQASDRKQSEYIECDFGIRKYRDKDALEISLAGLDLRDREYIRSLPWPVQKVWHLNDERMRRIQAAIRGRV